MYVQYIYIYIYYTSPLSSHLGICLHEYYIMCVYVYVCYIYIYRHSPFIYSLDLIRVNPVFFPGRYLYAILFGASVTIVEVASKTTLVGQLVPEKKQAPRRW